MSVLKNKRRESSVTYVNNAYNIYIQTLEFVSRLSSRYSRIMATDVTGVAWDALRFTESANSIFPSDVNSIRLREEYLLKARASIQSLDVALSICYDLLMKNPSGAFTRSNGKDVDAVEAVKKLDSLAQSLGVMIDTESSMITKVIQSDKERLKKLVS